MTTGTSLPKEYLPLGWVFLYKIKRIIRVLDRYKAEVYNLEAITSLAFRIESFGAAKVVSTVEWPVVSCPGKEWAGMA